MPTAQLNGWPLMILKIHHFQREVKRDMHTAVFIFQDEYSSMHNSVAPKFGFSLGLYFSCSSMIYFIKAHVHSLVLHTRQDS